MINKILEKYNLQWDDIFRKWKSYQILNSLGKITEKEIYEDLSLILNISKEDLEEIDMLLLESHILDEETRHTIIKLYEKGYYLGIISNNSIRNVEYILEREDIKKYFKKIIISEVGVGARASVSGEAGAIVQCKNSDCEFQFYTEMNNSISYSIFANFGWFNLSYDDEKRLDILKNLSIESTPYKFEIPTLKLN